MITKHEEQLSRYFEHAMTASEEQNFLIALAASDEMRIAFRSQLELMKAVRSDKDALHAGMNGQPVAQVRNRTLAALGLSTIAATPFIEQELMRGTRSQAQEASMASEMSPVQEASVALPSGVVSTPGSWLGRIVGTSTFALAAGLALGVLSTVAVERMSTPNMPPVSADSHVSSPMNTVAAPATTDRPATHETIPAPNGLVNSNSHPEQANHSDLGAAFHHEAQPTVPATGTSTNGIIPTLNTSKPAAMHVKTKIHESSDSAAAK